MNELHENKAQTKRRLIGGGKGNRVLKCTRRKQIEDRNGANRSMPPTLEREIENMVYQSV